MPINLEGGCLVVNTHEVPPDTAGTVSGRTVIGRKVGAHAISLRQLEFKPGTSPCLCTGDWEETWFVVGGHGHMRLNEHSFDLEPTISVYVRPDSRLQCTVDSSEPLRIMTSRCPEPPNTLLQDQIVNQVDWPEESLDAPAPRSRLDDVAAQTSGDRWFRVLVDTDIGCQNVTQFVGSIPPSRAPNHFHEYEEVIYVLEGNGFMWAGEAKAPIGPGDCVFLPRGQVHCVENKDPASLKVLGMFFPSGSPGTHTKIVD